MQGLLSNSSSSPVAAAGAAASVGALGPQQPVEAGATCQPPDDDAGQRGECLARGIRPFDGDVVIHQDEAGAPRFRGR
jgi:hypothetical protein